LLHERLEAAFREHRGRSAAAVATPSVLSRFEETGRLARQQCLDLGLVGPWRGASGVERDVRYDFSSGFYALVHIPMAVWNTGDVFARAYVRWLEIQRSTAFLRDQLPSLPEGPVHSACGAPQPNRLVVSLAESWRGEICHVAVDRWARAICTLQSRGSVLPQRTGLALAMRDGQISGTSRLCNKSFNLSYCGA